MKTQLRSKALRTANQAPLPHSLITYGEKNSANLEACRQLTCYEGLDKSQLNLREDN